MRAWFFFNTQQDVSCDLWCRYCYCTGIVKTKKQHCSFKGEALLPWSSCTATLVHIFTRVTGQLSHLQESVLLLCIIIMCCNLAESVRSWEHWLWDIAEKVMNFLCSLLLRILQLLITLEPLIWFWWSFQQNVLFQMGTSINKKLKISHVRLQTDSPRSHHISQILQLSTSGVPVQ